MRKRKQESGLTVNGIAGTYVVTLGLDLDKAARKNCLGFAIQRTDHSEDEKYWMRGVKCFQATEGDAGPGDQFSSREHPFQSFQWADYTAKPDHEYTYRVLPIYGSPTDLKEGQAVSVKVKTESEGGETHSVFFNRGAAASQAYATRFHNKRPAEVGRPAYDWLSRGLFEAMLGFIERAKDSTFSLHGAIYEFQWPDALKAIKEAHKRGAKVHIVYDGIKKETREKNEAFIKDAGIKSICTPRTKGTIMHNKFLVLSKNDKPIAVWTGSTNWTENGIFGHSNVGHIVEEKAVAEKFLDYWTELKKDQSDLNQWVSDNNDAPPDPWEDETLAFFSPRNGFGTLDWYAQVASVLSQDPEITDDPQKPLFMTFPFGMDKRFLKIYQNTDGAMRMALMEKEGNGKGLAQGRIDIAEVRKLPNVIIALGNNLKMNSFDRWLAEMRGTTATANVLWIHTKYMLVNPLGENPITIIGSANFSNASTNKNNENMLVIRGNKRVADIYLGEFMRLHSHYAFREAVAKNWNNNKVWKPQYLNPTAAWQDEGYFKPGSGRSLRREYFAGT